MAGKLKRNELCPCGSGLKYKKCCLNRQNVLLDIKTLYFKKYNIYLKDKQDIDGIKQCGQIVIDTLERVSRLIRPGMTTDSINTFVHDYTLQQGAIPAPLNYKGFPKSVCVSVNEVICHGIPGHRILKDGDIVNVDITSIYNGYYADANQTFFVGIPSLNAQKIVNVSLECLRRGIDAVRPHNTIGDIGWAIQSYAESQGCSVVRELVGHGVGFHFHEQPQVPHFGKKKDGIVLIPGMVFTIEPMINLGKKEVLILEDNWTTVTRDGSLSAQFEQTVLVTEDGYESLTPYDLNNFRYPN
ncbi:MAG: type I methionyl aminopeptidase [Desulfobacterales bacterium]|nr:type I methionyl aminopeptidase [Desulfobacterales bacterium]